MPGLGKSISLYLMDGDLSGRVQATLSNWNAAAYKIPRGRLKDCFADLPEIRTLGVYFLFGPDASSSRQFLYVGESDEVLKRLCQLHPFESDGSSWTEAIVFVTPDKTLEKSWIQYLENRFFTIARDADRYLLKNTKVPPQPAVSRQTRDLLESFIMNALLITPTLGCMAFEPLKSKPKKEQSNPGELLFFSRRNGKSGSASGKLSDKGFYVLKGSFINPEVSSRCPPGIKKLRQEYASLIGPDGILQKDILFTSPSAASGFVCGSSSDGLLEWRNEKGISLKDLNFSPQPENSRKTSGQPKPQGAQEAKPELMHLSGRNLSAKGFFNDSGFTVLKGSGFSASESNSCPEYTKALRRKLLAEGKVQNGIFTEDVVFSSPSGAASCILGRSANGKLLWRREDNTAANADSSQEPDEGGLFYLKRTIRDVGVVKAVGRQTEDGFIVLRGSRISPVTDDAIPERSKLKRQAASIDQNGVLETDMLFRNPTAAAVFVTGKITNGLTSWKDENGNTLKNLTDEEEDA